MQSIAAAAEPPFEDKLQSLHDQQTQLDQLQKQLEQLQQLKQQLMGKSQEAQAKLRSQDDQISDQDTELLKAHSDHKRLLLSLDTMQQQLDTVGHAPKIQELQESSIHAQDTTHSQESCHMPTHQENQDEMHDLMRKLMDASVEELRGPEAPLAESEATNIKTEEPTFSETVLEPAPVNDRLSLDQMDIQETSQKIGQAKTQINFQIQQLKDNKGLIESADDQLYYDMIYKKLTGQLADLTTAEEKIELYKSLLQEYHVFIDLPRPTRTFKLKRANRWTIKIITINSKMKKTKSLVMKHKDLKKILPKMSELKHLRICLNRVSKSSSHNLNPNQTCQLLKCVRPSNQPSRSSREQVFEDVFLGTSC